MSWWRRIWNATFGRGHEDFWRDAEWLGSNGTTISANTVLGIAGVWKAVNVIGKDMATLPLHKYKRLQDGKERVRDDTTRLVNQQANLYVKSVDQRLAVQVQALLMGNGYAEVQRDGAGRPIALWWLPSDQVEPTIDEDGWLWYVYRAGVRPERRIRPENMLHIRGPAKDGIKGWSVVTLARESLALTMGQERYAKTLYEHGVRPSMILRHPGMPAAEQRKEFRETIERAHGGADKAFRLMLLYGGWDASPWTMSNQDAQWLQGRQFQIEEIARWFDLPPHKLGAMGRATWSNVESMQLEYVSGCLQYWLTQWQQECDSKLLTEREKMAESHFYEFKLDALLRGNTLARYQAYAIGRSNNWLSPNEIRELENMNPIEDEIGDSYENPNTSSPSAAEDSADDLLDADDTPDPQSQNRLRTMATVETQLILMAAERSKNFTDYVERLYASGGNWHSHVVEVFASCDLDPVAADRWCSESKQRLLDLTERVTQRELLAGVGSLVADWPLRTDELLGGV